MPFYKKLQTESLETKEESVKAELNILPQLISYTACKYTDVYLVSVVHLQ